jgi:hypothetical protein
MVVQCSTAIGCPTGKPPGSRLSASHRRGPGAGSHHPGQLASIPRPRPDDDVAGPGHACHLPDAGTSRTAAVTMAAGPAWAWIGMCEAIT